MLTYWNKTEMKWTLRKIWEFVNEWCPFCGHPSIHPSSIRSSIYNGGRLWDSYMKMTQIFRKVFTEHDLQRRVAVFAVGCGILSFRGPCVWWQVMESVCASVCILTALLSCCPLVSSHTIAPSHPLYDDGGNAHHHEGEAQSRKHGCLKDEK